MANDFQGKEGQQMPHMDDEFLESVTDRYVELYEKVTGKTFSKAPTDQLEQRIMDNTVPSALNRYCRLRVVIGCFDLTLRQNLSADPS